MIISVIREYHWTPDQIDNSFIDDADHNGLEFWYQDLVEQSKKLPKK